MKESYEAMSQKQPLSRSRSIIQWLVVWLGVEIFAAIFLVIIFVGIYASFSTQNVLYSLIAIVVSAISIVVGVLSLLITSKGEKLLSKLKQTTKIGFITTVVLLILSFGINGYLLIPPWASSILHANASPTTASPSVATLASCPLPGNPTNPEAGHLTQMEDDASQWGINPPKGDTVDKRCVTNPSIDGTALKIGLPNGQSGHPYTEIIAYRDITPANGATFFELSLSFYFTSVDHMQSFVFSMSKWTNTQRLEWALQWEIMPDGTSEAGNPPTWRVWDGGTDIWRDTHIIQQLSPNTWHKLDLKGDISNGQVHYISFSCDSTLQPLGQVFRPVSDTSEGHLAITVQLHADAQGASYQDQMYIDGTNFQFEPV
jgi:hypothetical protein